MEGSGPGSPGGDCAGPGWCPGRDADTSALGEATQQVHGLSLHHFSQVTANLHHLKMDTGGPHSTPCVTPSLATPQAGRRRGGVGGVQRMRGCLEGTSVIQRHVYGVENAGSGERLAGGLGRGAGVGPLKFRERGGCGMIRCINM